VKGLPPTSIYRTSQVILSPSPNDRKTATLKTIMYCVKAGTSDRIMVKQVSAPRT
jgi:hypothetical protein